MDIIEFVWLREKIRTQKLNDLYLGNKIIHDFNFFFLPIHLIVTIINIIYNKKNISCQKGVKEKSFGAIWK